MRYLLQALSAAVSLILAAAIPVTVAGQPSVLPAPKPIVAQFLSCGGSWSYSTNYPFNGTPPAGVARFGLSFQDGKGNDTDITFVPSVTALTAISASGSGTKWSISLLAPQSDQDGIFHLIGPSQKYSIEVGFFAGNPTPKFDHLVIKNTGAKC